MRAVIDLVLIPLVVATIGGWIAGPWGLFLGLAAGFTLGAARGRRQFRRDELQQEVAEKDQRIAELEQRVDELEDD